MREGARPRPTPLAIAFGTPTKRERGRHVAVVAGLGDKEHCPPSTWREEELNIITKRRNTVWQWEH